MHLGALAASICGNRCEAYNHAPNARVLENVLYLSVSAFWERNISKIQTYTDSKRVKTDSRYISYLIEMTLHLLTPVKRAHKAQSQY